MDFFSENKPFYRGNLHCHTTESDGVKSPEEAIAIYQDFGYDFLALTDHRKVTVKRRQMAGKMLLLPGIELDYMLGPEVVHIVGFGMTRELEPLVAYEQGPQAGVDAIRACGGRAILAHPHWSLNTMATLTGLHGVTAAEIYNTMSYLRPDSSEILDVCAAHGRLFPLVASDDTHETTDASVRPARRCAGAANSAVYAYAQAAWPRCWWRSRAGRCCPNRRRPTKKRIPNKR